MSKYEDFTTQSVDNVINKRDASHTLDDENTDSLLSNDNDFLTLPELGMDEGVTLEIDDPTASIEVEINIDNSFHKNLALELQDYDLENISTDLTEKYDQDKEARKKRDEQYNEGMRRAGLDEEATPSGANFEGSSEVVHPMITENCIDFAAREIRELAPPGGPVKAKIVGNASAEKVEVSQRKTDFLNLVLTEYTPYRAVLEKTLTQLPLGGGQFIKFWHDEHLKRPMCEFVPIDRVFIPYSCSDFYTADRVTVRMTLSAVEYWRRVNSGLYCDPDTDGVIDGNSSQLEEMSKTEQTSNVIEGKDKQPPVEISDDAVDLLEIYAYLMIDDDDITKGEYAPYIITIKESTGDILSIYRNWDEEDKKFIKLDHLVMFEFIPWRGAYPIGLGQIIGSMSVAATGALRALLDAAHVNNLPTALALKGLKMAGQTEDMQVGQITYMEGPSGLDSDIKKMIMPLPFNPPSPVLFNLLEWLTNAAGRLVKMPDGGLESMGDRTPASTSMAMIEQNSMTQSAIHQRLHAAQAKCFKIVCRLLAKHYDPAGYPTDVIEDLKVNQKLFSKTFDIIPVSDPNIFTAAQRYAQIQMVAALNQQFPGMLNPQEIVKRTLQLAQVPDPDLLLNTPNNVSRANPVAENMALSLGQQIGVFPNQDHLAHFKIHAAWLMNPLFGGNPLYQDKIMTMANHLKEHLAFLYASAYETLASSEGIENVTQASHDNGQFDEQLVEITPTVDEYLLKELTPYKSVLDTIVQAQQAQQQAQMQSNPQMAKVQVERERMQQQAQLQQAQQQAEMQKTQMESQTSQTIAQLNHQSKVLDAQAKQQMVQAEIVMERDKTASDLEVEKAKLLIEKLKAITAIKSQDANFELNQIKLLLQEFGNMDKIATDLDKHQRDLTHNVHMSGIEHAQRLLEQQQAQPISGEI